MTREDRPRRRILLGLDAEAYAHAEEDDAFEKWRTSDWREWREAGRPDGWVWERDPAAVERDAMLVTLLRSLQAALTDEGHWCAPQVAILINLYTDRAGLCAWDGRPLNPDPDATGRPAEYCSDLCRKAAKAKRRSDLRKQRTETS